MATKEKANEAGETTEKKPRSRAKPADTGSKQSKTARKPADTGSKASDKKAGGKKTDDNYTDPDLREKLKNEIMAGDKGGKPGQWSARKAQLLTHEYEKAGGGYKSDQKTESQQSLENWTDEDWQTADGQDADRPGGTTRYLPKDAWDQLSPAEKKKTNAKKQAGSRAGQQHVPNTEKARQAKKKADK